MKLKEIHIPYKRELIISGTGNKFDYLINGQIILEMKAKPMITKDDYFQIQRYMQILRIKLGILVNFHQSYIKPKRIVLIETNLRSKFA